MEKTNVFVYGTLRKDYGLHDILVRGGAIFVGAGLTVKKYGMTADSCPFVHPEQEVSRIIGEVYKVGPDLLRELDRVEGYHGTRERSHYFRETIDVELDGGPVVAADIYFNEKRTGTVPIPSGDYKDLEFCRSQIKSEQLRSSLRSLQIPASEEDEDAGVFVRDAEMSWFDNVVDFVYVNGIRTNLFVFEGYLYNIERNTAYSQGPTTKEFTLSIKE